MNAATQTRVHALSYVLGFAFHLPVVILSGLMFGTYYRPARDEFPPTGLAGPPVRGIEAATYGPLIAWRRMAGEALRRG